MVADSHSELSTTPNFKEGQYSIAQENPNLKFIKCDIDKESVPLVWPI